MILLRGECKLTNCTVKFLIQVSAHPEWNGWAPPPWEKHLMIMVIGSYFYDEQKQPWCLLCRWKHQRQARVWGTPFSEHSDQTVVLNPPPLPHVTLFPAAPTVCVPHVRPFIRGLWWPKSCQAECVFKHSENYIHSAVMRLPLPVSVLTSQVLLLCSCSLFWQGHISPDCPEPTTYQEQPQVPAPPASTPKCWGYRPVPHDWAAFIPSTSHCFYKTKEQDTIEQLLWNIIETNPSLECRLCWWLCVCLQSKRLTWTPHSRGALDSHMPPMLIDTFRHPIITIWEWSF